MKRVMVVGGPGSGKSTLAVALGRITGLPVFHMDQIHYKPGWIEQPRDAKIAAALAIEAGDKWIFEGGLSATYANRCARADTVIWLDLPVTLRLRRIVKRRVQYRGQTRPALPADCPERLNAEFLTYIVHTRQSAREMIASAIAAAPHLAVHHIRTAKGADTWLDWRGDELQHTN